MKLKSFLFFICFSVCFAASAANQHIHPQANNPQKQAAAPSVKWPGPCEIEILNHSYDDVRVFGVFDDGAALPPFVIYSFESPHYISLYYYGYCHAGMDLYIDSVYGDHIYAGYTRRQTTVRIVPYLANQLKVEINAK